MASNFHKKADDGGMVAFDAHPQAEAFACPTPSGSAPKPLKSITVSGSSNAAYDGDYYEAESVMKWAEKKNAALIGELDAAMEMVNKLTAALNTAQKSGHTIVTDPINVLSGGGPPGQEIYISAYPGGPCFKANVAVMESYNSTFHHETKVEIHVLAYFTPKPEYQSPLLPLLKPLDSDPWAMTLKSPHVSLTPSKWVPPTVKHAHGYGGGLPPAAVAKNELAAKKSKQQLADEAKAAEKAMKAAVKFNVMKSSAGSTLLKLDELLAKCIEHAHAGDYDNLVAPVKEKWVPDGYVEVATVGQKEKKLVKKNK